MDEKEENEALAMPDVVVVLVGDDGSLAKSRSNRRFILRSFLATDRLLFPVSMDFKLLLDPRRSTILVRGVSIAVASQ